MIIVEGPDGAGKTTLIEWIETAFGLTREPRVVGSDTIAMVDLKAWVEEHNGIGWARPAPKLYDRHRLISEFIYGPIMGRPPEPGFDDLGWVANELIHFYNHKPILIYCLPPIDYVRRNVRRADTDNSAVENRTDGLWVSYSRMLANDFLFADAFHWDYTETSYGSLFRHIQAELRKRAYPDVAGSFSSPARPADRRLWG